VSPLRLKTAVSKRPILLAVDPSLTCSGWATFCLITKQLLAVGEIKALGPEYSMGLRLKNFQTEVQKLYQQLDLNSDDIVICEAPTTMRDPRAALLIEQVRCVFECLARNHGSHVPGRINPRTVHKELLGFRGLRQQRREVVKGQALAVAKVLYGEVLATFGIGDKLAKHQDIADALLIGNLALGWIHQSKSTKTNLEIFFEQRKRSRSGMKRAYAA
jgi:Holliday junction resolvasome RuvABC endonuclease subunit